MFENIEIKLLYTLAQPSIYSQDTEDDDPTDDAAPVDMARAGLEPVRGVDQLRYHAKTPGGASTAR